MPSPLLPVTWALLWPFSVMAGPTLTVFRLTKRPATVLAGPARLPFLAETSLSRIEPTVPLAAAFALKTTATASSTLLVSEATNVRLISPKSSGLSAVPVPETDTPRPVTGTARVPLLLTTRLLISITGAGLAPPLTPLRITFKPRSALLEMLLESASRWRTTLFVRLISTPSPPLLRLTKVLPDTLTSPTGEPTTPPPAFVSRTMPRLLLVSTVA